MQDRENARQSQVTICKHYQGPKISRKNAILNLSCIRVLLLFLYDPNASLTPMLLPTDGFLFSLHGDGGGGEGGNAWGQVSISLTWKMGKGILCHPSNSKP